MAWFATVPAVAGGNYNVTVTNSSGSVSNGIQATVLTAPVGAIAPGVLLVVLVVGVNLLADGLRDVADPTRRGHR